MRLFHHPSHAAVNEQEEHGMTEPFANAVQKKCPHDKDAPRELESALSSKLAYHPVVHQGRWTKDHRRVKWSNSFIGNWISAGECLAFSQITNVNGTVKKKKNQRL